MLFILHKRNHPELKYREGQPPIVHLQADVMATIRWAEETGVRWAFSDRNAGGRLAEFYKSVEDLDKIDWAAVGASDVRDSVVKEGKQAEFLVHEAFPWELVEKVGVLNHHTAGQVSPIFAGAGHRPPVVVEPTWYY